MTLFWIHKQGFLKLFWAFSVATLKPRSDARILPEGMHEGVIMVSVHSLTQDSRNALNRSRTGKNPIFQFIRPDFWTGLNGCRQRLLFARQLIPRKCSLCLQGKVFSACIFKKMAEFLRPRSVWNQKLKGQLSGKLTLFFKLSMVSLWPVIYLSGEISDRSTNLIFLWFFENSLFAAILKTLGSQIDHVILRHKCGTRIFLWRL